MDKNLKDLIWEKVDYITKQYIITQGYFGYNMNTNEVCVLFLFDICRKTKISNFDALIKEAEKISNNSNILHEFVEEIISKKTSSKNDFMNCAIRIQDVDDETFKECVSELRERLREATPSTMGELLSILLEFNKGNILDAYSGWGFFDIDYLKHNNNCKIEGYDISNNCIEVAKLINIMMNYNVKYYNEDLLKANIKLEYYDRAFADTPLGLRYNKESLNFMGFKEVDISIKNNTMSISWISAIKVLASLKKDGKGIITTQEACLFNMLDREIRRQFIDKNYISQIIKLPSNLLPYTSIPIYLIVIDKNKKDELVRFSDISNIIIAERRRNLIDVKKAIKEIENNSISASKEEIQKNDYSLDLNRYFNKDKIKIEHGVVLETVAEIYRGYQITASQVDDMITENEKDANYKLLEISNVDNDGNIDRNLKFINTGKKNLDKYLLKDGDIILSARGEKTKIAIVEINNNERIIPNGSIVVVRSDKNKLDSKYLRMFLNSEQGKMVLKTIKTGIIIPSINIGPLGKIEVKCPSMEEQQRLVDKFSMKYELYKASIERTEKLKQQLDDITNEI